MYLCDSYKILPIAYFFRCQLSNVYPHPHFSEHYIVKMVDAGVVKSVFKAFDPEETGTIDLFFLREIIYAYGINTTNDICLSLGQVKKEGKSFAFDEVLEKVNAGESRSSKG